MAIDTAIIVALIATASSLTVALVAWWQHKETLENQARLSEGQVQSEFKVARLRYDLDEQMKSSDRRVGAKAELDRLRADA